MQLWKPKLSCCQMCYHYCFKYVGQLIYIYIYIYIYEHNRPSVHCAWASHKESHFILCGLLRDTYKTYYVVGSFDVWSWIVTGMCIYFASGTVICNNPPIHIFTGDRISWQIINRRILKHVMCLQNIRRRIFFFVDTTCWQGVWL